MRTLSRWRPKKGFPVIIIIIYTKRVEREAFMTYKQWAQEYLDTADILNERVRGLVQYRKTAPAKELRELNFRIGTMRSMYIDCVKTASDLSGRKGEV